MSEKALKAMGKVCARLIHNSGYKVEDFKPEYQPYAIEAYYDIYGIHLKAEE